MLAVRNPVVVLDWSTNAYQSADLALDLPRGCFTNHYHRDLGQGIDVSAVGRVHQVAGWCRVDTAENDGTAWHTVENRRHTQKGLNGGQCRKDFSFLKRSVGMHYKPYGGKTGRAMVKYPLYKKNNSRKNTLLYPGLTTVSFDRIITYMQYYYVMCQRGSLVHRCYVQLDPESADILHDSLEQRYDLVQVCDVTASEVEPDTLIAPAP